MLTALQGHFTEISSKVRKLRRQRERSVLTACLLELYAPPSDRMSASRRRRFRDVFTSCCTPAMCC